MSRHQQVIKEFSELPIAKQLEFLRIMRLPKEQLQQFLDSAAVQ